jgi:hypothetical protein
VTRGSQPILTEAPALPREVDAAAVEKRISCERPRTIQVAEHGVEVRGWGVFIIYDVPAKLKGDRGLHPRGFQYMLQKLLDTGKIRRVQQSVLLVEDPALVDAVLNLILRYGGSALVVEGGYTHYLPERWEP